MSNQHQVLLCSTPWPWPIPTQDPKTGKFDIKRGHHSDWAAWEGLWIPCAGSIAPWQARLGGEEYEPDARHFEETKAASTAEYAKNGGDRSLIEHARLVSGRRLMRVVPRECHVCAAHTYTYMLHVYMYDAALVSCHLLVVVPTVMPTLACTACTDVLYCTCTARYYGEYYPEITQLKEIMKPYKYGFVYEAKVHYDGSTTNVKHYPMGRVAVELGYVMPDRRTVYITDDGTNVGFFKFVADKMDDLSAGTLYAGKFTQVGLVLVVVGVVVVVVCCGEFVC